MNKQERLYQQAEELEREYRIVLTTALSECAAGRWGLFGHNEHLHGYESPKELGDLRALAQAINRFRARVGVGPFSLHDEFEAARGRADANAPGEPKQAEVWLLRVAGA
ncbi:hypothetical protein HMF7854_11225 [Sphingomonas ginkgonis]|uniref:Uncharacterized protein n=1 Tax=Sphingomonas ginkgonis TaxID=2315330 RepID=A0A429VBU9_9SPHN|nr:hypothetical protein [Sphingomonas ginkgonis]RST31347.1 hypothetical protein HMF7854_11225 [Sphingomonas ginkgonis]